MLRAGVACGSAIPRGGDWYGRPVNLASRITAIARPGSLLVDEQAHDALEDSYRWSFAGGRRLKGIDGEVKLFRCRRPRDENGAALVNAARVDVPAATLEALMDAAAAVLAADSLQETFDRIARRLGELVPYDDLVLYEVDPDQAALRAVFADGNWVEEVMAESFPIGEGITGRTLRLGATANIARTDLDSDSAPVPGTPEEPEALVCVPLLVEERTIGALNVYRNGDDVAFSARRGRGHRALCRDGGAGLQFGPPARAAGRARRAPTSSPACSTSAPATSGSARRSPGRTGPATRSRWSSSISTTSSRSTTHTGTPRATGSCGGRRATARDGARRRHRGAVRRRGVRADRRRSRAGAGARGGRADQGGDRRGARGSGPSLGLGRRRDLRT